MHGLRDDRGEVAPIFRARPEHCEWVGRAGTADGQSPSVTHLKSSDEWRVVSDKKKVRSEDRITGRADSQSPSVTHFPVSAIGSVR